jgi:hypothetical protein
MLSAYLRYFLPWNVYRLARLFPALPLVLRDGDAVTDLGSGPLTLPLALWIARPELRRTRLEFRCLDRTPAALEAGEKLFLTLTGGAGPWKIRAVRGTIGLRPSPELIRGPGAALVTAVNIFDELFRHIPPGDRPGLDQAAARHGGFLSALAAEAGSILTVEPGIPRSGETIGAVRASLTEKRRPPRAPCPHSGACPLSAPADLSRRRGKGKWCHFAFDTGDAPPALLKLSAAAGLPKERATLSFLLAGPAADPGAGEAAAAAGGNNTRTGKFTAAGNNTHADNPAASANGNNTHTGNPAVPVRIISDPFPLPPDRYGRYGCSEKGLILVTGGKGDMEKQESGTLLTLKLSRRRDPKSGAWTAGLQ